MLADQQCASYQRLIHILSVQAGCFWKCATTCESAAGQFPEAQSVFVPDAIARRSDAMDAKHRNRILVLGKYKNEGGPNLGVAELTRNLLRNPKPKLRKVAHGQR